MRFEDIVFVVDQATAKDIDEGRSQTVLKIFDDFVTEFGNGETVLSPEVFVAHWARLTYLEKIRFLADYGY